MSEDSSAPLSPPASHQQDGDGTEVKEAARAPLSPPPTPTASILASTSRPSPLSRARSAKEITPKLALQRESSFHGSTRGMTSPRASDDATATTSSTTSPWSRARQPTNEPLVSPRASLGLTSPEPTSAKKRKMLEGLDLSLSSPLKRKLSGFLFSRNKDGADMLEDARLLSHVLILDLEAPLLRKSLCATVLASQIDSASTALFTFFDAHAQCHLLLEACLVVELNATTSSGSLFRGTSLATKVFSAFLQAKGEEYLAALIHPVLSRIVHDARPFEVDPSRAARSADASDASATSTPDLTVNQQNLVDLTGTILSTIQQSAGVCPIPIKSVLQLLKNLVAAKFGADSAKTMVGGFFFLRFVCPSLVAPSARILNLLELAPDKRRTLVLVSKIIQNISNSVLFADKEAFMSTPIINGFIESRLEPVGHFLDAISNVSRTYEPRFVAVSSKPLPAAYADSVGAIQRLLIANQAPFLEHLETIAPESTVENAREVIDALALTGKAKKSASRKLSSADIQRNPATASSGLASPPTPSSLRELGGHRTLGKRKSRDEDDDDTLVVVENPLNRARARAAPKRRKLANGDAASSSDAQ